MPGKRKTIPVNTLLPALKLKKAGFKATYLVRFEKKINRNMSILHTPQVIKLFRKICRRKYKRKKVVTDRGPLPIK